MIREDNACALLSYCFKPFANSEEASLNSRWGGSLSKLQGEQLSLLQNKTLTLGMQWVDSPNQLHPQQSTLFWHRGPWQLFPCPSPSPSPLGVTFTAWRGSLASWPGLNAVSEESFHWIWAPQFVCVFWELTLSSPAFWMTFSPCSLMAQAQHSLFLLF